MKQAGFLRMAFATITSLLLGWLAITALQARIFLPGEAVPKEVADDFDRNIAPILAANCLECHRGTTAQAKLDLSHKATAFRGGESGPALVAREPKRSLIWERIEANEMPPKHPLPEGDKKRLREWIARGANWGSDPIDPFRYSSSRRAGYDWWSLQPLATRKIPETKGGKDWCKNEIDHFILSRLEQAGLSPSGRADPRTLVRRLYIDLIGLPAPAEVIDRFAADPSAKAWERLVDDLLASHHYGERWARHWLDVVRFGESNGYEYNEPRETAWHFRDWVIRALNEDLPYDQFARLQLAGDILKPNTLEGTAAVGMLVAGLHNTVFGVTPAMRLQAKQDDLEELAGTVAQTFLGLTVNCARCHDHKFDPISAREYYSFAAALAGVEHGEQRVPLNNQSTAQLETRERERTVLHDRLVGMVKGRNGVVSTTANQVRSPELMNANRKGVAYRVSLKIAPTTWASAAQATGKNDGVAVDVLKKDGSVVASGAWRPGAWDHGKNAARYQVQTLDYEGTGAGPIRLQIRPFPENSDRFGGAVDDLSISEVGTGTVVFEESFDGLQQHNAPGGQAETGKRVFFGATSERWEQSGINTIHAVEHAVGNLALQLYSGPPGSPVIKAETDEERKVMAAIEALDREIRSLHASSTASVYSVASVTPGVMHVFERGDVKRPAEEVSPDGLKAIQTLSPSFGLDNNASDAERRRHLADWISHRDNALFHRVIVNRVWHYHFGSGIVMTPSDFGFNGSQPSHPELLDWLAIWFRQNGYSLKKLHKLIVTSSTYQQSSRANPKADEAAGRVDRGNRLLWRQNPRRVEAEVFRDGVLACGGALHGESGPAAGGPPFRDVRIVHVTPTNYYLPFDPVDEQSNRRTIYRWHVRGQRSPLLDTFDCPDPSVKTPQRTVSTTPSQALSQWNDSFVLRMSNRLAERIAKETGPSGDKAKPEDAVIGQQVDRAWRLVLGRLPDADEKAKARRLVAEHGLALLCRVLVNSNEFIYID